MTNFVKNANEKKSNVPPDKFYIIHVLFFILGLAHFLPWSFFTTATKYWMYKFRNTTIDNSNSELRTPLQAQFSAAIRIALQVSAVSFLVISILFNKWIPLRTRCIGILTIMSLLFVVLTAFVKIDTDSWQGGFFAVVIAITAGINSMNSALTITLYTMVARFPQRYLASHLLGSGLAKLFTASLQILSLATGLSVQDSALVYFSLGLLVIVGTLLFFVLVSGRNRFYLHHMQDHTEERRIISFSKGYRMLKKTWSSVVMMGLDLLCTNVSPTALVVSENEGESVWSDVYFIPTITFLLAAICEMIGRSIAFRFVPKLGHKGWVTVPLLRTLILIPLFMLSNAQPRNHLPVVLSHDYQYIILTIVSNTTLGYLLSRVTYNIAGFVTKEELKDAYHVNMLFMGFQMAVTSVLGVVAVNLL